MAIVEAEIVTSSGTVVREVVVSIDSHYEGCFRPPLNREFCDGEKLELRLGAGAAKCGIPTSMMVRVQYVEKGGWGGIAGSVVRFTPRIGT